MTKLASPKAMPKAPNYVTETQYILDLVAREVARDMQEILDRLGRSGRGLGEERLTPEQRLLKYQKMLADPQGWTNWLMNLYNEIESTLAEVPPELRAKFRVGQDAVKALVVNRAIQYRAEMVRLAGRLATKYAAGISPFPEGPSLPFPPMEGAAVMVSDGTG